MGFNFVIYHKDTGKLHPEWDSIRYSGDHDIREELWDNSDIYTIVDRYDNIDIWFSETGSLRITDMPKARTLRFEEEWCQERWTKFLDLLDNGEYVFTMH